MMLLILSTMVQGQTSDPTKTGQPAKDPLATKQQIVRDRVTQLEDRLFRLTERLAESEPEQAKKLEQALRQTKELLIHKNMNEIIALLEQGSLADAADRQIAVTQNLQRVLDILLAEPDKTEERKKELDRLQEFRDRINDILKQQHNLKTQTDAASQLPQVDLQPAIAQLDSLIDRQQKAIEKTNAAAESKDPPAIQQSHTLQQSIRQDTESTSRKIKPSAAANEVNKAANQMKAAEKNLADNQPAQAIAKQKQSLDSLKEALEQLKQQSLNQQKTDLPKISQQQNSLQKQTQKLANQMQGQKSGSGKQQDGQSNSDQQDEQPSSPSPSQPPAPGSKNAQQAARQMKKAAENLDKQNPDNAARNQQQAIDQLEQAQRELQDWLDQLRQEQQEETLRGLESRFRAMLAQQQIINTDTQTLDQKGRQNWTRADQLSLAGLAQNENNLAEQADQALRILVEDGTTIVFPQIVEQLAEDMRQAAEQLQDQQSGSDTQQLQTAIATTLKELIEAVEKMCQNLQTGGGRGGSSGMSGGNAPLLPNSAELKLLRSCQQRIKRQTEELNKQMSDSGQTDKNRLEQLKRITKRQQEIAEMAGEINEQTTGQ